MISKNSELTDYNDITKTQNCSRLKDETPAGKNNGATTILQYGKKIVVTLNPMCHNIHFQSKIFLYNTLFFLTINRMNYIFINMNN